MMIYLLWKGYNPIDIFAQAALGFFLLVII